MSRCGELVLLPLRFDIQGFLLGGFSFSAVRSLWSDFFGLTLCIGVCCQSSTTEAEIDFEPQQSLLLERLLRRHLSTGGLFLVVCRHGCIDSLLSSWRSTHYQVQDRHDGGELGGSGCVAGTWCVGRRSQRSGTSCCLKCFKIFCSERLIWATSPCRVVVISHCCIVQAHPKRHRSSENVKSTDS